MSKHTPQGEFPGGDGLPNMATMGIPDPRKQDDFEVVTINGAKFVKIGDWLFDPFIGGSGDLGITVYPKNETDPTGEGRCVDIFIDSDLNARVH